jgi:hypothetical protein
MNISKCAFLAKIKRIFILLEDTMDSIDSMQLKDIALKKEHGNYLIFD